jgi:hypothetical protein
MSFQWPKEWISSVTASTVPALVEHREELQGQLALALNPPAPARLPFRAGRLRICCSQPKKAQSLLRNTASTESCPARTGKRDEEEGMGDALLALFDKLVRGLDDARLRDFVDECARRGSSNGRQEPRARGVGT